MCDGEKEGQEPTERLKECIGRLADLKKQYQEMKKTRPDLHMDFFEGSDTEEKLKTSDKKPGS